MLDSRDYQPKNIHEWRNLYSPQSNAHFYRWAFLYSGAPYPKDMIHHISIGVSDINASGAFYDAILFPLGYIRAFEDLRPGERHQAIGYGSELDNDKFTLKERYSTDLSPGPGFHLAFSANSKEEVNQWHAKGIEMGAQNRGEPKIWSKFGPNYYAAYLVDREGWQIEAVFKMA